jgi:ATP-binding cassette subfamily B protein
MKSKYSNIEYPPVSLRDVLKYVWQAMKGTRLAMALAFLTTSLATCAGAITPYFFKQMFDEFTRVGERSAIAPQIFHLLFIILGLNFFAWICWRAASYSTIYFQSRTMMRLRQQAFDHLVYHSYSFFANNFTGALVQRVGRYARAFERLSERLVWNVVPLVVRLAITLIVVALTVDVRLTYIILVWAIVYLVAQYWYARWRLKFHIEAAEADSKTTGLLADDISNQNNIELFGAHEREMNRFNEVTEAQYKITRFNWNVDAVLEAVQGALVTIIEFSVLYFVIVLWRGGQASVGTFILVQMYVLGLADRLWDFGRVIRDFYEGFADSKEMAEIMKLPLEIKDLPSAESLVVRNGEVKFENVSFAFKNEQRKVLGGLNVDIRAGEKVALVGPSGAGKTTFIRLLLRFYDVTGGSITVDGQNIAAVTLKSLHEAISLVPQDPLLFHRTVMENIRYGRESASDAEVMEAARMAHCDEFVRHLSHGYDTYVGERGVKLSGGERQRVAIARALLKNAPILILDEATSSLDSESESLIQDALSKLMSGRTTIVIAHRLSTIRKMDRIIVLSEGNVIEEGSHNELIMHEGSLYKKLWTLQAGGFIQ